jgi:esterase/lipase superfamily enzyme
MPHEQQHQDEAERLAQLPPDVQRQAVAIIRAPADNPKVGKRDREEARQRADALERHLRRLNRAKKKL